MSVRRWLEQILAAALWLGVWVVAVHAQTAASRADRPFSVTHYDVQLEPRLDSRTVTGTVTLSVVVQRDNVDTIALDRGRLEIDAVEENGQSRAFVLDGNRMRITLPRGRVNQPRQSRCAIAGHLRPVFCSAPNASRSTPCSRHRSG